jgi:hypothetical protein
MAPLSDFLPSTPFHQALRDFIPVLIDLEIRDINNKFFHNSSVTGIEFYS